MFKMYPIKRLFIFSVLLSFLLPSLSSQHLYASFSYDYNQMPKANRALLRDLILLNHPLLDWVDEQSEDSKALTCDLMYDVVIVGGGMAGLTAGAALFKEEIFHIKLFDENPQGLEGPWITYARMKTLRSPKDITGPALEIPHLTFRAWHEATYGAEAWDHFEKIPNELWMDYLKWYREAMQLPVENGCQLVDLIPLEEGFFLEFKRGEERVIAKARKVILATGRSGFGGPHIPEFARELPKTLCAHTSETIDFESLKNKRIGIIGVGTSAFDAAGTALEAGVKNVDLIMRRSQLPNVNKFAALPFAGFSHGYFKLPDEKRWKLMGEAFNAAIPPPPSALQRVASHANFRIISQASIQSLEFDGDAVVARTSRGNFAYDFIIFGTGFHVDGRHQPELARVVDQIALWKDRLPAELSKDPSKMGNFPYLGSSFEFLPKENEDAPYLKNLYCFNYGAMISHGLVSSDIPMISAGATRLAQGIAAQFFIEKSDRLLEDLNNFEEKDFEQEEFSLNIE